MITKHSKNASIFSKEFHLVNSNLFKCCNLVNIQVANSFNFKWPSPISQNLKQELHIKLTNIAHLFTITNFLVVMNVFFIFCDQNAEFDFTQSLILSELGMYIAELTSTVAMHVFSCSDIIHLQ